MSTTKLLLIGRGPLPADHTSFLGFSQLRTRCFYDALVGGGHSVRLVLLGDTDGPESPEQWDTVTTVREEGPGWLDRLQDLSGEADAIISAGPYNPGRAACLIAGDRPVWADLPGDPFAELNALALATQQSLPPERVTAAEAAALPVLARADAISVISTPQRHAAMGELGTIGRLAARDTMPELHVLPIAHAFGLPASLPVPRRPNDPFVVALSGAFNPWFDDQTVTRGLTLAMKRRDNIHVIVTGGGIEGFYTDGYARFEAWCNASSLGDRIQRLGWIPHGELPGHLAQASIGLTMDRPGPEPELGSRTRLLFFIQMGLLPVSTALCELAREMKVQGELVSVPPEDPNALADTLCDLADAPKPLQQVADAQARLSTIYASDRIAAPLVRWARSPVRRAPAQLPAATLAAALAHEQDEIARIHDSPTWKALSRLHRMVRRD